MPAGEPGNGPAFIGGGLRRQSLRLLASAGLVNVGLAASSVFVSLFFYLASDNITGMALYAIGRYLGLMIMSVVVVALFPSQPPRRLFRAGVTLTAAFYLVLIALGRGVASVALPLGLLNGAASGVYWFGNNTLVYDVVAPAERGRYYGWSFGLLNMFNVVAPLAAGLLITTLGGRTGYVVVFALASATYLAAWRTARRLRNSAGTGGVSVSQALALPLLRTKWAMMWAVVALRGFKQAAGGLGLVVLVALATHSAAAQGEFASVSALAGVATSVAAGRLRRDQRPAAMWLGAVGFIAATALLFVRPDLVMLLVYGATAGLVYPAVMVPVSSVVLEAIDQDPRAVQRRGGYILSRELAANCGRLVAVGLLLGLLATTSPTAAVLATLGIAAVLQLAVAGLSALAQNVRL